MSSLVPWSTVERWSVESLRHGGSDSRNFPIEEFLRVHFRTPPSLEALRHDVYPRKTIERAWSDSDVREGFTELVPGVPIPETTELVPGVPIPETTELVPGVPIPETTSRGRRTRRPW